MKLKICHLYPDVLNLYGDGGNIRCLTRRLQWRGMEAELVKMPIGSHESLAGVDLVFIGGGQDFEQQVLLEDLHRGRDEELRAAIEDGVTVLAVCGGYQMLGAYYETYDGQRCDFIGALDLYTVGARKRMIGNYMFRCDDALGGMTVVGFENHSGRTRLGSGVQPLGTVLAGFGNNGEDKTEGAHYKNVFGTYSHGPMLPKNPDFADLLLRTALERRCGSAELAPLDDALERMAHAEMCARLERERA
ncbi:MAG: glutamine amidotransferase [Oscillospiraceae bacterium]|nr:glutamine amidotransferase [Oscillospiraceae bacterium]